jgi:N-acetylglucosaminyl-diphospho-decaprenol L-rhamnosyltransferase
VPSLDEVTVIVVTRDSAHCLPGLDPLLSRCGRVIISDNASSDGTAERAAVAWPHARVMRHPRNLGFGAANNRALAQVDTPWAFLLNPDCSLTPEQLSQLLDASERWPQAAVIAPQLVDPEGGLEVNYRWPRTTWPPQGPEAQGPVCVGFVCGAAMLLRLERFAGVGFFDERFFLYHEDDDLCLRLFQARRPIIVVPAVRAVHRSRGSARGDRPWRHEYVRGYHHAQSKLIFAAKHGSVALATGERRRLLRLTLLALPLRVLAFSPRLIARMWGRLQGLRQWRPDAGSIGGGRV